MYRLAFWIIRLIRLPHDFFRMISSRIFIENSGRICYSNTDILYYERIQR